MRLIKSFKAFESKSIGKEVNIKDTIKNLRSLSKELKEVAIEHLKQYTRAGKGKVHGLRLHSEISKKARKHSVKVGFDMGLDSGGYFIHTHRARSKSYETPGKIPVSVMRFVTSTG